jgi:DNA-binding transcriptional LysR family regulator
MENWDDFRIFSAIARTKTHRKASAELGLDQATVGRRLRALEERLGAKLLERQSEGYFLTELGKRILSGLERIETEFDAIGRVISGADEKMEGLIRIAAPGALANHLLIPRLQTFLSRYPKITLQFLTGPDVVNLAKREADIALRLVRPDHLELQLKKIGPLELGLYAHEDFLKRRAFSGDLATLPFVALHPDAMSELESKIHRELKIKFHPTLVTHAWSSVFSAVVSGVGAGILPSFMARREQSLIQLNSKIRATCPVWIAYHSDLKTNARVQALLTELQKIDCR